jgi:hypothetical protein
MSGVQTVPGPIDSSKPCVPMMHEHPTGPSDGSRCRALCRLELKSRNPFPERDRPPAPTSAGFSDVGGHAVTARFRAPGHPQREPRVRPKVGARRAASLAGGSRFLPGRPRASDVDRARDGESVGSGGRASRAPFRIPPPSGGRPTALVRAPTASPALSCGSFPATVAYVSPHPASKRAAGLPTLIDHAIVLPTTTWGLRHRWPVPSGEDDTRAAETRAPCTLL